MTAYKVGDTVECLDNYGKVFTKGKLYIVRAYNVPTKNNSGILFVEEDDKGNLNSWMSGYFKLYTSVTTIVQSPCMFKVGDLVRAKKDDGTRGEFAYKKGEIYTVIQIETAPNYPEWINLRTKNSKGLENGWSGSNFERVTSNEPVKADEPQKCRCDFRELLMKGCQCGGV